MSDPAKAIGAVIVEEVDKLLNTATNIPVEDREQLARLGADAAVLATRKAAGEQGIDAELEIVRTSVVQLTVAHGSKVAQQALAAFIRIITTALTFAVIA